MKEKINEEITVVSYYNSKKKQTVPYKLNWQNKDFLLGEVDFSHTYMEGQERQHIFELTDIDNTLHFRLRLNSLNLHWTLEAIHDGLAT